jgi:hypothetical protein
MNGMNIIYRPAEKITKHNFKKLGFLSASLPPI